MAKLVLWGVSTYRAVYFCSLKSHFKLPSVKRGIRLVINYEPQRGTFIEQKDIVTIIHVTLNGESAAHKQGCNLSAIAFCFIARLSRSNHYWSLLSVL